MFSRILTALFGRGSTAEDEAAARAAAEQREFQALNQLAPVKETGATAVPSPSAADATSAAARSVICREAVLNREQRIEGYEFLLRPEATGRIHGDSRRIRQVYDEVLVGGVLQFSITKLLGERRAFIGVLDTFLSNPLVDRLAGSTVALTIMPFGGEAAAEPLIEQVQALKQKGCAIALEECFAGAHFDALAAYADYFMIRTMQHTPEMTKELAQQLRQRFPGAMLVAKELESFDDFELCRKLDFALFQGPFVTSREDWTGNQVGPQTLHVCDLLNRLRRDADTSELALILKQDAVLSYRLLRYINSAAAGLRQSITSIENALVLMGRQKIYRWLTLLLFGSVQDSPHAAALLEIALVRGRFMELVGEQFSAADRDALFVVGLFSMLDLVLRVSLPEALKPLSLPDAVSAALLCNEGPYAPLLDLAVACETLDQERIRAAAARCGVAASSVNAKHFEALAWAREMQV